MMERYMLINQGDPFNMQPLSMIIADYLWLAIPKHT